MTIVKTTPEEFAESLGGARLIFGAKRPQHSASSSESSKRDQRQALTFSEAPPAKPNKLPNAPTPDQFASQEAFEEAKGYWQGHVGRIKAMAARAQATKDSQPKYPLTAAPRIRAGF